MLNSVFIAALLGVGSAVGLYTPDLDRAELERTYAAPPSQFIAVDGLRIHYRDTGPKDAQVLLLLHGFGSSLQTWDYWAEQLEKNYRVIRLDLPGFGLTGPNPNHDYSDEADLQTLTHFCDALRINELSVMGHSMGGKLAWNFAAASPQRVKRLVLMAPDGFPKKSEIGVRPYKASAVVSLMKYVLPKYLVKKSIEPAFDDPSALGEESLQRYYDMLRAPGVREAIIERGNQTVNTDPTDRLKRISAATLLLWGQSDQMIPPSNAKDYEQLLMYHETQILPHLGHLTQEERPAQALGVVQSFLKEHPLR
jgi:pimeloyl-ACP methyl ester carboxylesterase